MTGCDRVSAGCDNCYAMTLAPLLKARHSPKYQRDGDPKTSGPGFGLTVHPDTLDTPKRWRKPRKIFVCSMSDLFHNEVSDDYIRQVFEVMESCPQHTFQVLTKRSRRLANLRKQLPWSPNVWVGVSVESSQYLYRVDHLRVVPAAVRFLSAEPLLGALPHLNLNGVGWVIVGGESGKAARPMAPDWARGIRDRCATQEVPFFFKQWGGVHAKQNGRTLDGREHDEFPTAVLQRPLSLGIQDGQVATGRLSRSR